MDTSTNLKLPFIQPAQAQKHITHNEAIRALDVLAQICILDKDLTEFIGTPTEGDCFIVANNATGDWAGKEKYITAYQDGAWAFYFPQIGWLTYVTDEGLLYVFDGTDWVVSSQNGLGGISTVINASSQNAENIFKISEEELTLTGTFVDSSIIIPDRAIVFAVTTRTTQAITGASAYDCGIAGELSKYGGSLGISVGATNSGVTGPTAFYADTPIRISANGGNFTGGKVRCAIHYMLCTPPEN